MFFGVVILALFLSFHAALVYHGRQVVAAAAQDGLRAAQVDGGSETSGMQAAQSTLDLAGNLESENVQVQRTDLMVTVTVTARVATPLFPVFDDVSFQVEGPVERFISEADRQ